MAVVAVTAAEVATVFPEYSISEIIAVRLAVTATKGQALYMLAAGTFGLADANQAGRRGFAGVALEAGLAGSVISMLKRGFLYGYTLGTYADHVYLSDTEGAFDTAEGSTKVYCGRVSAVADKDLTEVLYIDADWISQWE